MFFVLSRAWNKEKKGRDGHELRNRPRSPQSLCGQVAQHRSAESEGLRFNSSWELRSFSLSYACDETKNTFIYFFTEIKLTISLILFTIQKDADHQNQPKSSTQSYTAMFCFMVQRIFKTHFIHLDQSISITKKQLQAPNNLKFA